MFNRRRKKQQELLNSYKKVKDSTFDFEGISWFFRAVEKSEAYQIINDRTLNDLDFEELFMYLDRTQSVVGQQYLYSTLRSIPKTSDQSKKFEKIINHLSENRKGKESAIYELSKLNKSGGYFIQRLIFEGNIAKPKWFWLIPLLSITSIAAVFLSFFHQATLLFALPILAINSIIHFWNKNNILGYSNTIPQLLVLHQVATKLTALGLVMNSKEEVESSIKALRKVVQNAFFFKWDLQVNDELSQVVEYILDLIKGVFLIEPILFFKLLKRIESHKSDIHEIFIAVAQIDVALSISSWRDSLTNFCFPEFSKKGKHLESEGMYHPLIINPTTNDFKVENRKSILLSGSNMSGKTTFIRTIGINSLLSLTLNTACASKFSMVRFNIHSAIRIKDDLLDDTSYYYEEVKTIKRLINEADSEHFNLFLLDELFKGTNTVERISSGKAVLSYLHQENNMVVCSTHDLELTEFLEHSYNYFHFSETIEEGLLKFDYKLKAGSLTNTNAIRILEVNNFPKKITDEARALAKALNGTKRIIE